VLIAVPILALLAVSITRRSAWLGSAQGLLTRGGRGRARGQQFGDSDELVAARP
jgi:hypothetical protein